MPEGKGSGKGKSAELRERVIAAIEAHPNNKSKKKGDVAGDAAAEPPAAVEVAEAAAGATPKEAGQEARGAVRAALERILEALANLQAELKHANRPSAACAALGSGAADDATASEWEAFLGGGEKAAEARRALLVDLEGASSSALAGFANQMREYAGGLKNALRSI